MKATELLQKVGDTLGSTATVRSVFGEPIHSHGKTIVPVAKVAYGFGGGSGSGRRASQADGEGEGAGGGGAVRASPAGVLEITDTDTRFVPFVDLRLVTAAFTAGAMLGGLVRRRHR